MLHGGFICDEDLISVFYFLYVKNDMGGRMNDIQTRLTCCCFHLVIKRKIYKLYGYDANKDFSTVEAHIFYEIQTVSQMK